MRDLNELFALCEFWEKEVRPRLRWEDCVEGLREWDGIGEKQHWTEGTGDF